jgi:DNA-directed RNA polymerase specialized sigma24 family protein
LDEETREKLNNANWDTILPKVLKYAHWRARMYRGLPSPESEDLVQEAISLAFGVGPDGTHRKWNCEKCPDLTQHLIGIIRSITSHETERLRKYRHKHFGATKEGNQQDRLEIEASLAFSDKIPTPEQIIAGEQRAREIIEELDKISVGDEEMQLVLMCIFDDGFTKPQEIADATGYEVKSVYNILKRIRRKARELYDSIKKE